MKTSLQPGFVMPKAVMALCVLGACATSAFAQHYPPQQPKPRVGTRFLNFVKDLVWGEEPDNRYQGYAPPPNSVPTHGYGAQGGRRYNLDSPPPVADYDGAAYPQQHQQPQYQVPPPSRPAQPPSQAQHQNQNHLSQPQPYQQQETRDMPYTSPRQEKEKAPEPAQAQRREAVQEQQPAPVKQKPHAEEHKKVEESPPQSPPKGGLFSKKSEQQPKKEIEESLPESKPQKTTHQKTVTEAPKNNPPAETPKETVVASNNATKDKGADSPAPASTGSTLTGTRTTKAGLVKSPYPPYNELDVTGLPTGSLAMDPTTGKVFRVP